MRHLVALTSLWIAPSLALSQTRHQLDTIRVTAASRTSSSLVASTRSVEVISRDDIQRLGARTVQAVLARAIAVDILNRSPASADISIRGTSLGQVLVLVDGVRMTDRQTPHFDLDVAVPLANIERIEIVRGPASAQYGADAVGGVVNIVTSLNQTLSDLAAVTEKSLTLSDLAVSAQARGGSFGLAGGALALGPISAEHERANGHRAGTDYRATLLRASIGSRHLGASLGQAIRDFGANSFYGPYDSHERTATTTGELHLQRGPASVSLATRRHLDQFTLRRTDPAFYRNRHASLQTSLTSTIRYRSSAAIGAELDHAYLTSFRLGERRDLTGAAFAQATLAKGGTSADVGLRSDWSNGFGTFVSPSLAASYRLRRNLTMRGSASRAFRAPSWTERYYSDPANVGNPDLTAERFTVAEFGARVGPLDVAAWARRGSDVIDWVKPTDSLWTARWRTRNISTIDYRGLDAELRLPVVTTFASLLTFDASNAAGYTGKYALRPLTSTIGARAQFRALTLDARHFLRAGDAKSHYTANAHLSFRVRDVTLSAHLENLTNADYLDVTGKPVAGRGITVGVAWP